MNKTLFNWKLAVPAMIVLTLALGPIRIMAEEAPAAPAAEAAPATPKLTVDQLIDQLMTVNPEEIKARIAALKGDATKLTEEAKALRAQADALDAKAAEMGKRVALVEQVLGSIQPAGDKPVEVAEAKPAEMAAPAEPEAAPAEPAPAPAPEMKPEMKPAAAEEAPKFNYADNVQPIFMAKCASCHNQDKAKGGFIVDAYEKMMEGGGSGKVVVAGQSGQSRLFRMLTHEEEPKMPLGGAKLDDASLEIVKKWIDAGALKDKTSKPVVAAASGATMAVAAAPKIEIEGDLPMPTKQEGAVLAALPGASAVRAIAASSVAPVMAVSGYKQILLYNSESMELLRTLPFAEGTAECLRFSPNGSLLVAAGGAAGAQGIAVLYDVVTGDRLADFGRTFDTLLAADITLDHKQIAVGGTNKKVQVYSVADGKLVYEITKHTDWIQSVRFSLDGWFLATGDRAGGLYTWIAENGRDLNQLRGHEGPINSLDFRPDSQVLASASTDGKILLWELQEGKNIKGWAAHALGALSVQYAADGRIVTCGIDKVTALWDGDGNAVAKFPPLGDWAYAACFLNQGARIAAGSWQGELKIWQVADAKEVGALKFAP